MVEVYDVDDATNQEDLNQQDFIGSYQFMLHSVINEPNGELTATLENPKMDKNGSIKIRAVEKVEDHGQTTC